MSLSLGCISWNDLPNIDDTPHLDAEDEYCMEEIKAVLLKYGKASRLGVAVLHNHFDLESDEVLVEHCDVSKRTLVSKPVKIEDMLTKKNYRPTIIRFDGERAQGCRWCVPDNAINKHSDVGC